MTYKIEAVIKPNWVDETVGFFNEFSTEAEAKTMAFGLNKILNFPGVIFRVIEIKNQEAKK